MKKNGCPRVDPVVGEMPNGQKEGWAFGSLSRLPGKDTFLSNLCHDWSN